MQFFFFKHYSRGWLSEKLNADNRTTTAATRNRRNSSKFCIRHVILILILVLLTRSFLLFSFININKLLESGTSFYVSTFCVMLFVKTVAQKNGINASCVYIQHCLSDKVTKDHSKQHGECNVTHTFSL